MPGKEEFEKTFNLLLGTEIKWSKLRKEDLANLAYLFGNPEILITKLIPTGDDKERNIPLRRKALKAVLSTVLDDGVIEDGPILERLKELF